MNTQLETEKHVTPPDEVRRLAMLNAGYINAVRQEFHQDPETRYETQRTRKRIRTYLGLFDNIVTAKQITENTGGLVADFEYYPGEPFLALRADIDALPVAEATDLPFASQNPGKMHACGHDVHIAWMLGFVKMLSAGLIPQHNIRIIFDDAEENPGSAPDPKSGAEYMIEAGALENVKAIFGLHVNQGITHGYAIPGKFYSAPGAFFANSGRLTKVAIRNVGGHVAIPGESISAMPAAIAVANDLARMSSDLNMVSSTDEDYVLKVTSINTPGGSTNVQPALVEMMIATRSYLPREKHLAFMRNVKERIERTVARFDGCSVTIEDNPGHPVLTNNRNAFRDVVYTLGEGADEEVIAHPSISGGESFAHYLNQVPGAFVFLGAERPGAGGHHSPTFNPDESVFWKGAEFFGRMATSPLPYLHNVEGQQ